MANNNETTTRFKVDISELKSQFQEASRQIRLANSEFKAATSGMDNWKNSADGVSAKIRQLNSTLDSQKNQLQSLSRQYALVVAEQGENSRGAQELAIRINNQRAVIGNTERELRSYNERLQELRNESEEATREQRQTETAINSLKRTIKEQEQNLNNLKNSYSNLVLEQGRDSNAVQDLARQIDTLSTELNENRTRLSEAERAADEFDNTINNVDESTDNASDSFTVMKGALANLVANGIQLAIGAMKDFISESIEVGKQFDLSMSNVAALSGATGDELQMLRDTAKEYGATTQFSASQAADALGYMALAGWDANQSADALGGVLNLAAASGMDLAAASDMVTDYMSAFNMEADESAYFADLLAYAQANANTTAVGLGEAFKNCAANMNAAGQDIETTTSLLSMMANQGLKGSQAGTALTAIMRDMTAKMGSSAYTLKGFSEAASKSGKTTLYLTSALEKAGVSNKEFNDALEESRGDTDAFINNLKKAAKEGTNINDIFAESGYMMNDLSSIFKTLGENQKNYTIDIGENKVAVTDANGNYRDMTDILRDVESATNGMGDAEKATALQSTFTNDSIKGLNLILNAGVQEAAYFEEQLRSSSVSAEGFEKALNDTGISIDTFQSALANIGITNDDFNAALSTSGGSLDGLFASMEENSVGADKFKKAMSDAGISLDDLQTAIDNSTGSAQKMADVMTDNLGGDLTALGSQVESVQIAMYEKFEPALRAGINVISSLVDGLKWVIDHGEEIVDVIASIATGVAAYLAYTTAMKIMTEGWAALTIVTKAQTAAQAALNFVMNMNPIGIIIGAITALVAAFVILWNKSEGFRNFWIGLWDGIVNAVLAVVDWIKENWQALLLFLVNPLAGIFKYMYDHFDGFREFVDNIVQSIIEFFKNLWDSIVAIWDGIVDWFKELFTKVSETIHKIVDPWVEIFKRAWQLIKEAFAPVIQWFKDIFKKAWDGIKEAWSKVKEFFTNIWNGIKEIFSVVGSWFKDKFTTAWTNIKKAFDPVKNFFTGIWDGIKEVFGHVSDWFKEKFTAAWEAVKNVFSTGGKIFDGIKDGIINGLKIVVNAIIRGINKVISIPFNGLNSALRGIKGIEILGVKPFDWINEIGVPQIPELYKGGVLKKGQIGLLEGNGTEAVVPLEKNTKWLDEIAKRLYNKLNLPKFLMPQKIDNSTVNNFYQTNNSPKPLSRLEIYRQSKNLLAMKR